MSIQIIITNRPLRKTFLNYLEKKIYSKFQSKVFHTRIKKVDIDLLLPKCKNIDIDLPVGQKVRVRHDKNTYSKQTDEDLPTSLGCNRRAPDRKRNNKHIYNYPEIKYVS